MFGRRAPTLDIPTRRAAALDGVPHKVPAVRTEERDFKLYVTVLFERPRWQRVLGADQTIERTFGLDAYGRRVYENCNGNQSVSQIVELFAEQTCISKPEAELAVTQFIRTLMSKGLVVVEMEKLAK